MEQISKLEQAKEIITEVEAELLETKGLSPYEIAYTLKNLDEAINFLKKNFAQ